jgi:hypothetical protein
VELTRQCWLKKLCPLLGKSIIIFIIMMFILELAVMTCDYIAHMIACMTHNMPQAIYNSKDILQGLQVIKQKHAP